MKRILIVMLILVAGITTVFADNGGIIITKDTESKHDVEFDVTFIQNDSAITVTVVAPKNVGPLSLSHFALIQIDNEKPTFRFTSPEWGYETDTNGPFKEIAEEIEPEATFLINQADLAKAGLEVSFGSGENQQTYIVDLSTYREVNDDGTPKPFPISVPKDYIEVAAKFTTLKGSDTEMLSAPRVTTVKGVNAIIEIVEQHFCPNGEVVNSGIMLNVTPTLEGDTLHIKGSAHLVIPVVPDPHELEKNVQWIGFKELNVPFSFETKDPEKEHRLGPIEMDGKKYEFWLSAKQVNQ